MRILTSSPEQTRRIGEALGRVLDRGDVVALVGELGTGKTVFAQGMAQGLGVGPGEYVSSPSFTLVNQYEGRLPVFHVDTYRLGGAADMLTLGYEELFDPDGVTIIEWADKVRELLPVRCIRIEFTLVDHTARELDLRLIGEWPRETESKIAGALTRDAVEKT